MKSLSCIYTQHCISQVTNHVHFTFLPQFRFGSKKLQTKLLAHSHVVACVHAFNGICLISENYVTNNIGAIYYIVIVGIV